MIYETKNTMCAAHLFDGWQETIVWSCLQGVMGSLSVDDLRAPRSAAVRLGDFYFLAGEPMPELVLRERDRQDFLIMVPRHPGWEQEIEGCFGSAAKKVTRYAMKKEPDAFDEEALRAFAEKTPEGYALKMIDEPLFLQCQTLAWCRDFVSQYTDFAQYEAYGLGTVLLKDGELVAGASSYSGYIGGIEIEIDTREDYRRRGLATICGARLILECLRRGLYPSCDAQNLWSVALAQKLGYHFDYAYTAYEIIGGDFR